MNATELMDQHNHKMGKHVRRWRSQRGAEIEKTAIHCKEESQMKDLAKSNQKQKTEDTLNQSVFRPLPKKQILCLQGRKKMTL